MCIQNVKHAKLGTILKALIITYIEYYYNLKDYRIEYKNSTHCVRVRSEGPNFNEFCLYFLF